ncbi:MAG: DUF177 domain-containing protein [Bacillota bacterium]|nr:DUF177 domain-containing protein [Bacillota bacterium]
MHIYLPEVKSKNGEAVDYLFREDLSRRFKDLSEGGSLLLKASAVCSGEKILISGSMEVSTKTNCSRCLEPFDYAFKTDFSEAFTIIKGSAIDKSIDDQAEQAANQLTVSGDYLYLDEYIRQMIILAQEYNPLCRIDCKGICPGCGVDRNRTTCQCSDNDNSIDVRLLKLKELSSGS